MAVKHIAILGSTGSIGQQCLEVVKEHPGRFVVDVLTASACSDTLIRQAHAFRPAFVAIANKDHYPALKEALGNLPTEIAAGDDAILSAATHPHIDMVVAAIVGFAGLRPVLAAIEAGRHIALANKETLVVAGEWVMARAFAKNVNILPVDSEHSAIFQCLEGEKLNAVEKIILTGSGGPFRGWNPAAIAEASPGDALRHPTWKMGAKITIDSASLMNKGLEVIEAKWLFNLEPRQIEVIIHPQSIIHSMVQFADGSIKAQMGLPDMRLPIQYAMAYPQRLHSSFPRFEFGKYPMLTFEKPDTGIFRNLTLAFEALEKQGNLPCVLNAANEVVVEAFLQHRLGFLQMPEIIEFCLTNISFIPSPNIDDLIQTDTMARNLAKSRIKP
jgi:1-deoxy-D-xylulose-5-phosphate reductoisomerase